MIDSNLGISKYYLQVMKLADKPVFLNITRHTNTCEEQLKNSIFATKHAILSNSLALPKDAYSTQYNNKKRAYHSYKYFHV